MFLSGTAIEVQKQGQRNEITPMRFLKGRVVCMLIDLTLATNIAVLTEGNKGELRGHIGTHFDVMNRVFPLEYARRKAILFDVRSITDREITVEDIDLTRIEEGMAVLFCSGFIEKNEYGSELYRHSHPQLSKDLIRTLTEYRIAIIGLDFAGMRRAEEHTEYDQFCADRNVFAIENLCGLTEMLKMADECTVYIFPMKLIGATGLPCRVIAEV